MVNIVPLGEVQSYLANGMAARRDLPYAERNTRRAAMPLAR